MKRGADTRAYRGNGVIVVAQVVPAAGGGAALSQHIDNGGGGRLFSTANYYYCLDKHILLADSFNTLSMGLGFLIGMGGKWSLHCDNINALGSSIC